ncbi:hypothetical protein UFOVP755_41 [uncultured Caudovirales phage]|uniref:Uncharacterized protein n=1 Tax=uncultured Caudovirales phage TaxID=2100421 RepID=A0A6J7X5E6_9CAUD|nr:hypothetical protein UFOVP755_41 [uncultured Caudovirales phage]
MTQTLKDLTKIVAELAKIAEIYSDDQDRMHKIVLAQLPIYAQRVLLSMCDVDDNGRYNLKLDLRASLTQIEDKAEGFYTDICDGETHQSLDDTIMEIVDALIDNGKNDHCFTSISLLVTKAQDALDALKKYSTEEFDWHYFAMETCEDDIEEANSELPSILEDVQSQLEDALTHTANDAFDRFRYDVKQLIADTDNIIGQLEGAYSDYCESIQAKTLEGYFDDACHEISEILFAFVLFLRPLCVVEFEEQKKKTAQNMIAELNRIAVLEKQNSELQQQLDVVKQANKDLEDLVKGFAEILDIMKQS